IGGYYNNKVERMRVTEEASGYTAELLEPLLNSSSRSFRPVDIKTGPDGAIYVLDWYNPIIGHYQASMRHPDRDKTHGRIWRITAEGRSLIKAPNLENAAVEDLLNHLKTDEHWLLYQVRRLLAEREKAVVENALDIWVEKLDRTAPGYEKCLMEALNIYASHEIVKADLIPLLVKAKHPGARGSAARLLGRWNSRMEGTLTYLTQLINDSHPRVRLEAIVALSYVADARAMAAALQVLDYPMDKFLRHALEKTTFALESYWSKALNTGALEFKSPTHLAWLAGYRSPPSLKVEDYKSLLEVPGLPTEVKRNLLLNIARIGGTEDLASVMRHPQINTDAQLLEALALIPDKKIDTGSAGILRKLFSASEADDIKLAAIRLIRAWKTTDLADQLETLLQNSRNSEMVRAESLLALVELRGVGALPSLVALRKDPKTSRILRIASLKALLQLDLKEAALATVAEIRRPDTGEDQLKEVVLPLLTQKGGVEIFTESLQNVSIGKQKASRINEILGAAGIYAPELSALLHKKSGKTVPVART